MFDRKAWRTQNLAAALALTTLAAAGVGLGWAFRSEGTAAGGELSFARTADNSIYTISADGTGMRKLRGSFSDPAYEADWSPDGSRIVFVEDCRLHVMNQDGSGAKPLRARVPYCERQPAWSPDGRSIAFSARSNSSGTAALIAVTDIDGAGTKMISQQTISGAENADFEDQFPDWSPDGTKIAFARTRHTGLSPGDPDPSLFIVKADGTGLRKIRPETTAEGLTMPRWSPDGSRLTMGINREGQMFVYVVGASGQSYTNLSPKLSFQQRLKGMTGEGWPVWSPDGSRLAFASGRGIAVMNADGSGRQMVTHALGDANPRWRPGVAMSSGGGMGMDWWPWWVTSVVGLLVVAAASLATFAAVRPIVRVGAAAAVVVAAGVAIAAPVVMTPSAGGGGGSPTMTEQSSG